MWADVIILQKGKGSCDDDENGALNCYGKYLIHHYIATTFGATPTVSIIIIKLLNIIKLYLIL